MSNRRPPETKYYNLFILIQHFFVNIYLRIYYNYYLLHILLSFNILLTYYYIG